MTWSRPWWRQRISKSEVSLICGELDRDLEAFRTRRLGGELPYVFSDATYLHRACRQAPRRIGE